MRPTMWLTHPGPGPDGKLENESLVSHFPTGPTTTADFPHPHLFLQSSNRTFHLLQKPDTLICYQQEGMQPG
jgi:hypothetical protein